MQIASKNKLDPSRLHAINSGETASADDLTDLKGKVNAINKSQAVIEFNLDGTIIDANRNFLNTLGYSLDEIKGKHHKMFCEPDYASSRDYQSFWEKLNQGEYQSGEFKRMAKMEKRSGLMPPTIRFLTRIIKFIKSLNSQQT